MQRIHRRTILLLVHKLLFWVWNLYLWKFLPHLPGPLQWRHNGHNGVSNHQPHGCVLNQLFRRGSKKTSKLRVTGLCAGNSPVAGEFPAQRASNGENISISWRHHASEWTISIPLIHSQLNLGTWVVNRHKLTFFSALRWRHNGRDCVSNHQPHDC